MCEQVTRGEAKFFAYLFSILMFGATTVFAQTVTRKETASQTHLPEYPKIPLYFEKNIGQTDAQVRFLYRGGGYGLFLTPTEAVLKIQSGAESPDSGKTSPKEPKLKDPRGRVPTDLKNAVVRMRFLGAKKKAEITGIDELEGKINYFIGNDPTKWLTSVPTFAKVKYSEIYPGVDVVYYGNQGHLEYDLQLQPKVDPSVIRLKVDGTKRFSLTKSGDLMMETEIGKLVLQKPVMYQMDGAEKKL